MKTAVTAVTANFTSSLTVSRTSTGNVSIAGTLTYEDVTNVDSVGIATARTGIDVTGGHIDLVDDSRIRVGTEPIYRFIMILQVGKVNKRKDRDYYR